MSSPKFAPLWVLGLFLVLMALQTSRAEDPQPADWVACDDKALVVAFEKSRAQKPWKVLFEKSGKTAWILGEPKKAGTRIEEGSAVNLHKTPDGDWREKKSPAGHSPSRYVIVRPPPQIKIPSVLTGRVYSQPILLNSGVSPEESILLVDATYGALLASRERKESADLTGMFAKDGQPYFSNVWTLDSKDRLGVMPKDIAQRFRYVGISQPNGETWIVFDIKDDNVVLVNVGFAEL
jgi:hypothetical protein